MRRQDRKPQFVENGIWTLTVWLEDGVGNNIFYDNFSDFGLNRNSFTFELQNNNNIYHSIIV